MKYETLSPEQFAEQVRSVLNSAETEHAQAVTALDAGRPGYSRERVEELEAEIKSLQAKLKDAEGKVK